MCLKHWIKEINVLPRKCDMAVHCNNSSQRLNILVKKLSFVEIKRAIAAIYYFTFDVEILPKPNHLGKMYLPISTAIYN